MAKRRQGSTKASAPKAPGGILSGEREGVRAFWDGMGPAEWETLYNKAERPPLEQAWFYGVALAGLSPYQPRFVQFEHDGETCAIAQIVEWKIAGLLTIAKLTRGPVFLKQLDVSRQRAVLQLIADRYSLSRLCLYFQTPELPASAESQALMRSIGARRMVTGYSSVWLPLTQDETTLRAQLHGKWRNQLRLAEKAGLRIRSAHGGASLEWLLTRHDAHRRRKRLRAPAGDFVRTMTLTGRDKRANLVLTAQSGSETLAGILVIRHGDAATYYVGWSSPEGRAKQAHNLLLWRAILDLKKQGVRWLDLGGIDGRTMPGVSRFKMGLGGEPLTLAGTYL